MRQSPTLLIARQFWRHTLKSGTLLPLLGLFCLLLAYASFTGWKTYQVQNKLRKHYQAEVRHEDGSLVASAQGTFKYWKGPLGGVE